VLIPLNELGGSVGFDFLLAGALLTVVTIGHFGLWIWLYNRINATGLNRKTIKRIEKAVVLACGLIPIALVLWEIHLGAGLQPSGMNRLLHGCSLLTKVYCLVTAGFAFVLAPFWIADRPQFATAKDRFELLESEDLKQLQHPQSNAAIYIRGARFRKMAYLPGNQIVSMQRNRKRLSFSALPKDLVGLRIAHLSDMHLTGQLSTAFYRLAVDWISEQSPDLIVLSGDIVDYENAIPQLRDVFDGLDAPLGSYFILGNHDKRLPCPTDVCRELCELGWTDLGLADAVVRLEETSIQLLGNELPWFRRHSHADVAKQSYDSTGNTWRIGVAHSPDQFAWGVKSKCNLLLCGHTHGGQIRLPVVGPIIAPSWYGSRFASGVFVRNSTLMHVSRGVSGVHPFRWGCMPEATILDLNGNNA